MFPLSTLLTVALVAVSTLASDLNILITGPDSIPSADNLVLTAVVTNAGAESVNLLHDPNGVLTPNWKTNTFSIIGDTGAPNFSGVKVKWSPTLAIASNKVTTLAPGESVEIQHDVSGIYDFAESGPGHYTVSATPGFHAVDATGQLSILVASVTSHSVYVSSPNSSRRSPPFTPSRIHKRRVQYANCEASHKQAINQAAIAAQHYITAVNKYFSTLKNGTDRYTTWFGAYDTTRVTTVKSHFLRMNNQPESTTYDCGCDREDTFAYVYPQEPGYIYLCPAFWQAPNTGSDSRGGTIVHETSHFKVNGGTDDLAYGQDNCKSLAQSDPSKAIENADSHEYFAENSPFQS